MQLSDSKLKECEECSNELLIMLRKLDLICKDQRELFGVLYTLHVLFNIYDLIFFEINIDKFKSYLSLKKDSSYIHTDMNLVGENICNRLLEFIDSESKGIYDNTHLGR